MSVNSHPNRRAEPRKRPVQARSRQSVETILDAAARIFAERGYGATTTNHVAAAADVSIGSLYQYFPNKDALLVALEERHLNEVLDVCRTLASRWRHELPEPETWARSLVDALIVANDSAVHVLIYDTAPQLPEIRELTGTVVDLLVGETTFHLDRWGHLSKPEIRARIVVVMVLRLVHDLAVRLPRGRRRTAVRDQIVEVVTASITD